MRALGAVLAGLLCALLAAAVPATAAPTATFSVATAAPHTGEQVHFSSTSSDPADPTGGGLFEAWTFGDGATGTGNAPSHAYSAPGAYTVTLTVTDAGFSDTATATVNVTAPPPPPNVAPVAGFGFAPGVPLVGQTVTFTSSARDSDGRIVSQLWDLDGNGVFDNDSGSSATWAYPAFGTFSVGLLVRDDSGAETAIRHNVVVNARPTAAFTPPSATVAAGDTLTLTSTSADVDGGIARLAWDLDGDGRFGDATTAVVRRVFSTPGVVAVGLRVTDDRGASASTSGLVTVIADKAPLAAFGFAPATPSAGEVVTFVSRSTDPDGTIAALAWDLDGDAQFDDAGGPTAARVFPVGGQFTVALRATDDRGASSVAFQTVVIRGTVAPQDARSAPLPGASAPGANPPGSTPSPGPRLMLNPFPIVHIRGRIFGRRVRIDLLSVRAPRGASVRVRCRGSGCRRRTVIARVASGSRALRMRGLERRYLPGAVLEVFVTAPGRIGKYVRFTIRRGAAPARVDMCISPAARRPNRCPGA